MKLNLEHVFTYLENEQLKDSEGKTLTMRKVLSLACLNAQGPEFETVDTKYNVYKLLRRVNSQVDEIDVKPEDAVLLKKLVARIYGVYIVGQVVDIIDGIVEEPVKLRAVGSMDSGQR